MTTRTFKFYGQAFSTDGPAVISVKFNGDTIFSGPVQTVNDNYRASPTDTSTTLFEYIGDINTTGNIPFELYVENGTVFFGLVKANYSGYEADNDGNVIITPEEYYSDVNFNTVESDGKNNVKIDDVPVIRQLLDPKQIGDWWYRVFEKQTFACDLFVDPDIICTSVS
jgi:hypothetical protein